MNEPWIRDPRPLAQIESEFWEASRAKAKEDREITALSGVARFEAILRQTWTEPKLEKVFYKSFLDPDFNRDNELDEWLAEDNPHRLTHYGVPGVLEALGLSPTLLLERNE